MGLFGPPDIGKLKAKRDVAGLLEALGNGKNATLRRDAAAALGELKAAEAIDPLKRALLDADAGVRNAAVGALLQIDTSAGLQGLVAAAGAADKAIRSWALEALAGVGAPAVPLLLAHLRAPSSRERRSAGEALRALGWQPAQDEAGALYWIALDGMSECRALGEVAIGPLSAALHYDDSIVRWHAAEALGAIGGARAVDALIPVLSDEEGLARRAAADGLGSGGDRRAVEPLIAALRDGSAHPNSDARGNVARALGKLGDARAVDPLIAALQAPPHHYDVCEGIAEALRKLGDARAVEPLVAACAHADRTVKSFAAEALRGLAARYPDALLAVLGSPNEAAAGAAAELLVDLYRKGDLSEQARQALLAQPAVHAMLEPTCALCGKPAAGPGAERYGTYPDIRYFCSAACWTARGGVLGSPNGAGCPFYNADRMCVPPGAQVHPCSCPGSYASCDVYTWHAREVLP